MVKSRKRQSMSYLTNLRINTPNVSIRKSMANLYINTADKTNDLSKDCNNLTLFSPKQPGMYLNPKFRHSFILPPMHVRQRREDFFDAWMQ